MRSVAVAVGRSDCGCFIFGEVGGRHADIAVDDVDSAVSELGQFLIVRHDNERLSQFVAEFEEELVQFGFVVGVERT